MQVFHSSEYNGIRLIPGQLARFIADLAIQGKSARSEDSSGLLSDKCAIIDA
jgi:hypothetical protein